MKAYRESKNLRSLVTILENLNQYRFIDDENFTREVCFFFSQVMINIKGILMPAQKNTFSGLDMITSDIEDILKCIDDNTEALEGLVEGQTGLHAFWSYWMYNPYTALSLSTIGTLYYYLHNLPER